LLLISFPKGVGKRLRRPEAGSSARTCIFTLLA